MGKGPGRRWQGPRAVGSSRPVGGTPGPFVRMAYLVAFCSPDSGGTASGRVPRHPGLRPLHACEPLALGPQPVSSAGPVPPCSCLSRPCTHVRLALGWSCTERRPKLVHLPPRLVPRPPPCGYTCPAQGIGSVIPGLCHPHSESRARRDPPQGRPGNVLPCARE